jgi:hypothetical protein
MAAPKLSSQNLHCEAEGSMAKENVDTNDDEILSPARQKRIIRRM